MSDECNYIYKDFLSWHLIYQRRKTTTDKSNTNLKKCNNTNNKETFVVVIHSYTVKKAFKNIKRKKMCWVISTKHEYRSCVVLSYILTVISLFFIFIYNAKIFIYTTFIFVYVCLKMYTLYPPFLNFSFSSYFVLKNLPPHFTRYLCVYCT